MRYIKDNIGHTVSNYRNKMILLFRPSLHMPTFKEG